MNIPTDVMEKLIALSDVCIENDEVPVSAIIFDENGIISYGYNKRNFTNKTIDHAEIIAINEANKKVGNWKLYGKSMIVTLEPCDMCKTVIKEARLEKVYYLLPRYTFKKQYKGTQFEELENQSLLAEKYKTSINNFFTNKRDKN